MSEVEKLYRKAELLYCNKCRHDSELDCLYMCENKYPSFTAEKQIELIKWLGNNDKDKTKELTLYNSAHSYYYFALHHEPAHTEDDMWCYGEGLGTTFEEGLAKLINDLWQELTEQERIKIKSILE